MLDGPQGAVNDAHPETSCLVLCRGVCAEWNVNRLDQEVVIS